jgi:transketolase
MSLPMGRPMRDVFGETVSRLADDDPRIVMLDGDLGSSTKADIFEHGHRDRFLQMGIAEQNMIGVAAGLASVGLMPFISTFVSFAVIRPLDQVRVQVAQTGLNVKLTAGYAGLFTGMAGKTHQIVDDISIMRAMPGMVTVSPADDIETDHVLRWAAGYEGPVYIRIGRDATQRLFDEDYRFRFGAAVEVRAGSDVTLISTGAQTPRVVDAADLLDTGAIVAAADRTGRVVTIEEHTVIGGLGGAVAETLAEHRPTRMRRIGLQDMYTESAPNDTLLELYGLSAERVAEQVRGMTWSS